MDADINRIIDKYRFKTPNKIIPIIKKDGRFSDVPNSDLRQIIRNRIHDKRIPLSVKKVYQVKIFSRHRNSWFTDLYDNLSDSDPRYWHVFINTNTRYAVAYPTQSKNKNDLHENLVKFVEEYHPRKITSDGENGITSVLNVEYLKSVKCGLFIVTEQQHSTLGIIDRFMRTLRDMNTPQDGSGKHSSDKEFQYISEEKMKELLDSYNNTIHSATGHTPKEMMDNPKLEEKYIEKCLVRNTQQLGISDFKLKAGDLVRYLLSYGPLEKKRYKVSRETYRIDDAFGNMYTIIADDGTTKTLPRWRLVKVEPTENRRMGRTLDTNRGTILKVLNRVGQNKARILFAVPGKQPYEDVINVKSLRLPYPQFESRYERNI